MRRATVYPLVIDTRYDHEALHIRVEFHGNDAPRKPRYFVVNGEDDVLPFILWLRKKYQLSGMEYQPNLFFTWEWEPAFENAMLHVFLTGRG